METDIKKILQKCLITVFSIFLIIILNTYLDRRLDRDAGKMDQNFGVVPEKEYNPETSYTNLYVQFPVTEEEGQEP